MILTSLVVCLSLFALTVSFFIGVGVTQAWYEYPAGFSDSLPWENVDGSTGHK